LAGRAAARREPDAREPSRYSCITQSVRGGMDDDARGGGGLQRRHLARTTPSGRLAQSLSAYLI
jgi:hypothetical protein